MALAAEVVAITKTQISKFREFVDKYHRLWYQEAIDLANQLDVEECVPRCVNRQKNRNNMPAESPEEYYKRIVTIPVLGV